MRIITAVLLLLATGTAVAANTVCFTGYAYHRESGKFAYTEHHEQQIQNGKPVHWKVIYRAPDGHTIAKKTMDFSENNYVPIYTLHILDSGYAEGIRHDDNGWRMIRRKDKNAKVESKAFTVTDDVAADAGFDAFVKAHFKQLMAGKTVKFQFAAAGRLGVIDLTAHRIADTTFEGKKAVRFSAELDMFLVHYFVKGLQLTYDPDSKKLLEYRGVGNLHNKHGNTYQVRVSYYSKKPAVAKNVSTDCGGAK